MAGDILIADIGGTNARFALVGADGRVHDEHILPVREHADLAAAVRAYLEAIGADAVPGRAAVGIASAILGDRVRMTNLSWDFSIEATRRELGMEILRVVNDLAAMALAIPHLAPGVARPIGSGTPLAGQPIGVIAPGTGLGISALVPFDGRWIPLASEGGHATVAPMDEEEDAIIAALRARFGHVSAERVLAGPGLVNLYAAICAVAGAVPDPAMEPAAVTARGTEGTCPHCARALAVFSAMLGAFAGNVALTYGALGGIYLAGGVVARIGTGFDEAAFRTRFEEKGRFRDYLSAIPTYRLSHDTLAFLGLPARALIRAKIGMALA